MQYSEDVFKKAELHTAQVLASAVFCYLAIESNYFFAHPNDHVFLFLLGLMVVLQLFVSNVDASLCLPQMHDKVPFQVVAACRLLLLVAVALTIGILVWKYQHDYPNDLEECSMQGRNAYIAFDALLRDTDMATRERYIHNCTTVNFSMCQGNKTADVCNDCHTSVPGACGILQSVFSLGEYRPVNDATIWALVAVNLAFALRGLFLAKFLYSDEAAKIEQQCKQKRLFVLVFDMCMPLVLITLLVGTDEDNSGTPFHYTCIAVTLVSLQATARSLVLWLWQRRDADALAVAPVVGGCTDLALSIVSFSLLKYDTINHTKSNDSHPTDTSLLLISLLTVTWLVLNCIGVFIE